MSGGKGAEGKQRTSTTTGDEKKERKDFSVEIIFSPIPYTVFSGWKAEMYVNKRKPNSPQCSVLQLAWSSPKGNSYGPCNETIFIDCSQNNLDKFKDVTDDKKLSLTAYLSYAINRLKSIIYKKTQDGGYGKVDVKIIAIHPCQKCLFALSALLGKKLSDSGVYSTYVSNIMKLDEYRYTFRWIQKEGWEFNVQYCAIFDAYRSVVEDTKGDDERIKELEELKKKYKDGDKDIPYEGGLVDYNFIESEYERLTDPSEEQLRENVKAMKKQKEEVEKSAARENYVIKQALNEQKPYEMVNIEVENLRNSSPKYKYKSKQELKDLLQKRGLIDTQHVKVTTEGASGYQKALGIDSEEHLHTGLYMIDGVRMDVWSIEKRKKEIQEKVDIANQNYELAQKALKDKEMAFVNGVLDALQLIASIGSIAFPPLALLDVTLTVCRWVGGENCTTQENIINGVGIAVDIVGLIPYFGTMAKVSRGLSRAAEGQIMDMAVKNGLKPKITQVDKMRGKLSQFKPDEELELIDVGSQDFNKMDKATQKNLINNSKQQKFFDARYGIPSDKNKNNIFVTVSDSKGNISTVEMSYDSAVETFGSIEGKAAKNSQHVNGNKSTIKASDLDKALSNELKPVIQNNEVAIKKARQDVIKGLHEELIKTSAGKTATASSTGSQLWRDTLDELKELYKATHSTVADVTSFYSNAYTWVMGVGYNGLSAIFNFKSVIKFDPKQVEKKRKEVQKQIDKNEKKKYDDIKERSLGQLDAVEEYEKATKDLEAAQKANDQEAIQSAERRQAAAQSLYGSQMAIDVYKGQQTIKQAQSNLDEAKRQEAEAKKYSDQAHANATASYFSSDADLAYYEAKANTLAAEEALKYAKENDSEYNLAKARAEAQMHTQEIEYEKEIYSTKDDKKKSSKKKK